MNDGNKSMDVLKKWSLFIKHGVNTGGKNHAFPDEKGKPKAEMDSMAAMPQSGDGLPDAVCGTCRETGKDRPRGVV